MFEQLVVGGKGTYIKVINEVVFEEIKKLDEN